MSRYFTWIVFAVAAASATFWYFNDPSKIWNSVTAVMIIACPCALLLSNTFTNGNILRKLGRNSLFLRNAQAIEDIANVDHIVFDKTGTLTTGDYQDIEYRGEFLKSDVSKKIAILSSQSSHPMSKAVAAFLGKKGVAKISNFVEVPGKGIEGYVDGELVALGSKKFIYGSTNDEEETAVYVSVGERVLGKFKFKNHYRQNVPALIKTLKQQYKLSVLSGDNAGEKTYLTKLLGFDSDILFNQKPEDKLEMIKQLQQQGKKVMMIGDGLNDAGALKQANVGISVTDNCNNFTPASDGIIDAVKLPVLYKFIKLCKINKQVVLASFIVSIVYNLIGIYFAVQGNLSPMIAAILMPTSSLSILLITFGASNLAAWKLNLK
jgi:P-type Cu+ transporter